MAFEDRLAPQPDEGGGRRGEHWAAFTELLFLCSQQLREALTLRAQRAALSEPQFALLWACSSSDAGLSQRELAARLCLSAAHVSGLVEQLSERLLIDGKRAANDRRRQIWRLSQSGRTLVDQVVVDLEPWSEQLEQRLSCGTRQRLEGLLRELAGAIHEAQALLQPAPAKPSPPIAIPIPALHVPLPEAPLPGTSLPGTFGCAASETGGLV